MCSFKTYDPLESVRQEKYNALMKSGFTRTPNIIFDQLLKHLSSSQILVLLIVIRQTLGWHNKEGHIKKRDWISQKQFVIKTGLSPKTISHCIDALVTAKVISASDYAGKVLPTAQSRKGKSRIYYQFIYYTNKRSSRQKAQQNLLNTKETPTKDNQRLSRLSDWERYQQIRDNEYE